MVARKLRGNIMLLYKTDVIALCRKKSKQQQQQLPTGTTVSDKETREDNSEVDTSLNLPADPTLLAYIAHVKHHIQPLPSIKDQVITLAM